MPTITEKTLKKDGSGDYTTINAWLAAEVDGVDFVSLDEVRRLKIFKAGWGASTPLSESFLDFGSTTTTSATQRPEIVCDGSETHDFTEGTGFVFTVPTSFGFIGRGNFVLIDGIEIADCNNTSLLWHTSTNIILRNTISHGISNMGKFEGDPSFCIFYDYFPASSDQSNDAVLAGNTTNCTIVAKSAEFGFDGDIMLQNGTANDTLIYKLPAKITFGAYFSVTGNFNGVNRAGEGVPGASSQTNLTTADFNDYANNDFRLDPASAFVTNGAGGSFMGAAVAPGGSGVTVTVTESGPSFTESISSTLTASIISSITESGPGFAESINVTLSAPLIQAGISEAGPSFTELVNANLDVNISAVITELGPSFTESISINVIGERVASIAESGPSFVESIIASVPIVITVNPKNIIRVKRKSNTVIIKRKSNTIRVK
ncbi:MAG: hypothetical protein CMJ25_13620 [Phycisphaerae bacterium]|nr:hypothetical protein [Phycisphaerae bacterium]